MAQKYLMALDYVDLHANSILQKHAKFADDLESDYDISQKRPLGELEAKHRYTPTQPVLSCRTVDIDVSGTRTYRPKSSADIITEQHALIHKIYSKARNIASAPPKRSKTPRSPRRNQENTENNNQNINKENNLKSVEVQGRPLTSLSQRPSKSSGRNSVASSKKRPKTTGGIKSKKANNENFMLVRANRDLIETKRSYRSITEKIHRQWDPDNHDLNTGTFQRGKKTPGVPAVDSWLTFSGSQGEDNQGLVDAFADNVLSTFLEDSEDSEDEQEDLERQGEYYNIEGGVGNRIAQQLQAGDKIRIGINGNVQTHDLKVKKWVKEDSFTPAESVVNGDSESRPASMAKTETTIIPLCWDDQVDSEKAKVITPRGPPPERATINLNETRPVVFTKLIPDDHPSNNNWQNKREGYRVKQRKKNKAGVDGREREHQKVTVVTIDSKTEDEEKEIASLTVEEVVSKNCKGKKQDRSSSRHEDSEKHSVTFNIDDMNDDPPLSGGGQSRVSVSDSMSGVSIEHKHPIIKPTQPTFSTKTKEVDLDIVGTLNVQNGSRPLSNESTGYDIYKAPPMSRGQVRVGSARSSRGSMKSAKSGVKSLGSGSSSSLGFKQNEAAEFIQIAHPMKAQNTGPQKRQEYTAQSMRSTSGVREPVPSPELEEFDEAYDIPTPLPPTIEIKQASKPAPSLSISIPTADYTDSALNSPTHKQPDLNASPQNKRAQNMRDEQIDQITDLLGEAIIGPDETEASRIS